MPLPDATLSVKEEALAGLATSIAAGCRPCTRRWLDEARAAGACERGIRLAMETGLSIRTSATSAMADFAASLQVGPPVVDEAFKSERARLVEVFACGAAFAVRSPEDLEHRISLARGRGATSAQMGAALAISRAVCAAASKEVDKVVRDEGLDVRPKLAGTWCCDAPSETAPAREPGCGCNGGRT